MNPSNLIRLIPAEGMRIVPAPSNNVVTLPLRRLDRDGSPISGERGSQVGISDIRAFLRSDSIAFVIADVGHPLRWVDQGERFDVWKEELQPRLVSPEVSQIHLNDYPNHRCYVAHEWHCNGEIICVTFEMHH